MTSVPKHFKNVAKFTDYMELVGVVPLALTNCIHNDNVFASKPNSTQRVLLISIPQKKIK
jgi:hypothetical protein